MPQFLHVGLLPRVPSTSRLPLGCECGLVSEGFPWSPWAEPLLWLRSMSTVEPGWRQNGGSANIRPLPTRRCPTSSHRQATSLRCGRGWRPPGPSGPACPHRKRSQVWLGIAVEAGPRHCGGHSPARLPPASRPDASSAPSATPPPLAEPPLQFPALYSCGSLESAEHQIVNKSSPRPP